MHTPGEMRCAWILACAASLLAQDARFDVRSRLVLAPVAVTDASGRPVSGLEASDFVVLDNGRPQKIVVDTIDTGVPRIALVIAVQASGIAEATLAKARKLGSMIQPIVTGDRGCAGLLDFDDRVNWLQECTGDSVALRKSFLALRSGDYKTARMLDAVSSAIGHLRKEQNARRVLLLISESRDRGSESTIEQVMAEAQAADVTIYAATFSAFATSLAAKVPVHITVSKSPHETPAQEEMHTLNGAPPNKFNPKNPPPEQRVDLKSGVEELARKFGTNTGAVLTGGTGGTLFPFTKAKALEEAIIKLGDELHSHYVISFAPDPSDEGYHALEFKVTRKGEFQVRARLGYRL
jgi:VWFA-related protein